MTIFLLVLIAAAWLAIGVLTVAVAVMGARSESPRRGGQASSTMAAPSARKGP